MNNSILSICLPTYNRSNIVYNTVKNIIKYPDDDIEIVISDNGSTDDTKNKLKSINDERISFYRNDTNMGFVYNLINVIEKSQSNYVFLLSDEDDICLKNLKKIINIIKGQNETSILLGQIKTENGSNYLTYKNEVMQDSETAFLKHSFTHHYMSGLILNKTKINFNNIWEEYYKKNHGYLDIYPHVYIMNLLLLQGITISTNLDFVKMREKGQCEMDNFDNKPYVHPTSRINLFNKNISLLKSLYLKKTILIQTITKLYLWTVNQLYAYYKNISQNHEFNKYFNIQRDKNSLDDNLSILRTITESYLDQYGFNSKEINKFNSNIKINLLIIKLRQKASMLKETLLKSFR